MGGPTFPHAVFPSSLINGRGGKGYIFEMGDEGWQGKVEVIVKKRGYTQGMGEERRKGTGSKGNLMEEKKKRGEVVEDGWEQGAKARYTGARLQ